MRKQTDRRTSRTTGLIEYIIYFKLTDMYIDSNTWSDTQTNTITRSCGMCFECRINVDADAKGHVSIY